MTSTIVDGSTVEEAVSKLEWQDGDLIMVGSSRLSAPKRLFLGSTRRGRSGEEVPYTRGPTRSIEREVLPVIEAGGVTATR